MANVIPLTDLARVLTSDHETYPHERRIATITFGAFLQFPGEMQMISRAQCFAASSVIRALHRGQLAPSKGTATQNIQTLGDRFFGPVETSNLLLDHDENQLSFADTYEGNNDDLGTAQAIAAFLLICPAELKPSINKALFFLEKDGFRHGKTVEKWRFGKASSTTGKKAWKQFGRVHD